MSKTNGQFRMCERCGAWVFCPCTGEGVADGGYTRWNTFDNEPAKKWEWVSDIGDLCPKCYEDYSKMFNAFRDTCKFIEKKEK